MCRNLASLRTQWGMRCKSAAVLQPCGESFCCKPFTEEQNGREPSRSATRFQGIPLNLLGTGGIKIRNHAFSYIYNSVLIPAHGFFLESGEPLSACTFFMTPLSAGFLHSFPFFGHSTDHAGFGKTFDRLADAGVLHGRNANLIRRIHSWFT